MAELYLIPPYSANEQWAPRPFCETPQSEPEGQKAWPKRATLLLYLLRATPVNDILYIPFMISIEWCYREGSNG